MPKLKYAVAMSVGDTFEFGGREVKVTRKDKPQVSSADGKKYVGMTVNDGELDIHIEMDVSCCLLITNA